MAEVIFGEVAVQMLFCARLIGATHAALEDADAPGILAVFTQPPGQVIPISG
ncbi:hypothetical protein X734_05880 [Mesorhizobium sp. L2C084A000]|nr:hypothetical protein X734_05880 [Mesorhizobium sp. L2C084A000]